MSVFTWGARWNSSHKSHLEVVDRSREQSVAARLSSPVALTRTICASPPLVDIFQHSRGLDSAGPKSIREECKAIYRGQYFRRFQSGIIELSQTRTPPASRHCKADHDAALQLIVSSRRSQRRALWRVGARFARRLSVQSASYITRSDRIGGMEHSLKHVGVGLSISQFRNSSSCSGERM